MPIDHQVFPHIIDQILAQCSVPALLVFGATSRAHRARACAILGGHLLAHTTMVAGKLPFSIRSSRGPLKSIDRRLVDLFKFENAVRRQHHLFSHTHTIDIIGSVMAYALSVLSLHCRPTHLRLRHDAQGQYTPQPYAIPARTVVVFGNLQLYAKRRRYQAAPHTGANPWLVTGSDKSVLWGPRMSKSTQRLVYNVEYLASGPDFISPVSCKGKGLCEVVLSFTKATAHNRTFSNLQSVSSLPMTPAQRLVSLANKILQIVSLNISVTVVDSHMLDLEWVGGEDFASTHERQIWLKAAVGDAGVTFLTREEYISRVGVERARIELEERTM